MNKLYLILGITAIIVLGYSFYLYLKPISSEDIKQNPTTSVNENYKLPPTIPVEAGKDKG